MLRTPRENRVDVAQLRVEIERLVQCLARQHAGDVGVCFEQRFEIALLRERPHRAALNPFIRLLARDAPASQLQQHVAREHDAARAGEILLHPIGIHDHAGDNPGESPEHVIERDEAVGQNHPLDRRMRDVALVPERDVLERGHGVGADQAREPGDLLAADRIALVRHRRRALLAAAKRLFDFADLRLLQAADLEREFLERGGQNRQRRHELGVTIALDHLRGHGRGRETQAAADRLLDRRIEMRKHADGPGDLADGDDVARALHSDATALELRVPEGQLHAERHRLGVDAVRAPDHRRPPVFVSAPLDRRGELVDVLQDQIARLSHLQTERRIEDVGRGQAEVQPAGGRADLLGDRRRKRNHVVLGGLLDLLDAGDVERRLLPQFARIRRGHDAGFHQRVGRGQLDLEPGFVAPLIAPDRAHLGAGVARNHPIRPSTARPRSSLPGAARRRWRPDDRPGTDPTRSAGTSSLVTASMEARISSSE